MVHFGDSSQNDIHLFFMGEIVQGGHDIPEAVIRRRFEAGKRLFATVYQPLVDEWALYDNAGEEPVLMDWSGKS